MNRSTQAAEAGRIDLGVASLETKGLPNGQFDEEGKLRQMGLTDD